MADLNALIAQGYQFQAPPDPFVQYAKRQQLDQGEQTNQLNQMKMQEYQRGIQEHNAVRGLDPSSPTYISDVTKISPKLGLEFGKLRQEGENAKLEFKTKTAALLKNKIDRLPEEYARADTPEAYITLHETIHADPELGPWLKSIGATKEKGRAKINEAIQNGTFGDLRAGSMQSVAQVLEQIEDTAYGQSRKTPAPQGQAAPGAVPMGAPNIGVTPLVPMPSEPMVAPAVMGLNANQARAELAVAPNALAPQVAPVNALAAAPTVDRVKQIDADLLKGNTSKYKNSTGWKDEKKILETERAELVKLTPEITNMKALGYPLTQEGFKAFREAQRQERLLTPEEEAQKLRLARAGATNVQTNVNAYTPASEEAQRDFIRSTRATYDTLKNAPGTLKNIEEAKKLIPGAKGFMGPGGESLLDAASFLNNRLGTNINTKGITDATELRSRLFQGIIENLRKLDANPTENQQNAMRVALGNIGTDPNALPAVLDSFADTVRSKVEMHNAEVGGAVARGVKFPYDPTVKLPSFTPPPPSGASLIPGSTPAAGKFKYLGKVGDE